MVKLQKEEYTVGWVCALPVPEWQASRLLFDLEHEDAALGPNVSYQYAFGEINDHNVVMGCLPDGQPGVGAAASVATEMRLEFLSLRFALLVGVGGGVPRISRESTVDGTAHSEIHAKNHDIRLGDVVVSCINKDGRHGGVVHYDYGKSIQKGGFQPTGMLNKPPPILSSALGKVRSGPPSKSRFYEYLSSFERFIDDAPEFSSPPKLDQLFEATYEHPAKEPTCSKCSIDHVMQRRPRTGHPVRVHYGTIASGNQVMKDAQKRDIINSTYDDDILCFEMEAAGLLDHLQCIVIRGICDYCDSHKNKKWQPFASATAAAWAKELLGNIAPAEVAKQPVTTSSKLPLPKTAIMLPYGRDKHFVGREDTFKELDHILAEGDVVGVVGLGGVGKSQVVIEYAYRVHQSQPNTSIFWVHASSRERFRNDYQSIATKLELSGFDDLKADHLGIVFNWLQSPSSGKWLMILDNADSKDLTASWQARAVGDNDFNIPKYLPKKAGCAIIVTSRDRQAAFDLVGQNIIKLEPMTQDEAVQLFRSKTRSREWDQVQAHRLSVQLDCIPLAITQAAAYIIARTRMTIGAYLELFQQEEDRLLSKSENDLRRDVNIPHAVIKTWEISFHEIQKIDSAAVELLFRMCFLSRFSIPVSLLHTTCTTRREFDEALETLMRFSFVDAHLNDSGFVKMHRLVQRASMTWIQITNSLEKCCFESLKLVWNGYPDDEFEDWNKCQLLEPHAESVLEFSLRHETVSSEAAASSVLSEHHIESPPTLSNTPYAPLTAQMIRSGLLFKRAKYAHRQSRLVEAIKMAQQAMIDSESAFGHRHLHTLSIGSFLAVSFLHTGHARQAKELSQRVFEMQRMTIGEQHSDSLATLGTLAMANRDLGLLEDAASTLSGILWMLECELVHDEELLMMTTNDLALVLGDQSQWQKKADLEETNIRRCLSRLGPNHPDILAMRHNLAISKQNLGRLDEARLLSEAVVRGHKTIFGENHASTLVSQCDLANVYWRVKRETDACDIQQHVLDEGRYVLPDTHPAILKCMSDVALYHHIHGRLEESYRLQRQALTLHDRKFLNGSNPGTTRLQESQEMTFICQERLAAVLKNMGRVEEAREMLQTCIHGRHQLLGAEHPSTIESRHLLSSWGFASIPTPDIRAVVMKVRDALLVQNSAAVTGRKERTMAHTRKAVLAVQASLLKQTRDCPPGSEGQIIKDSTVDTNVDMAEEDAHGVPMPFDCTESDDEEATDDKTPDTPARG